MMVSELKLKGGFSFEAIHSTVGLHELDTHFLSFLEENDDLLYQQMINLREGLAMPPSQLSDWIIQTAPWVEIFVAELFQIKESVEQLQAETLSYNPIFTFKKYFVLREAKRALKEKLEDTEFYTINAIIEGRLQERREDNDNLDSELLLARYGKHLLQTPEESKYLINELIHWCVAALASEAGKEYVKHWISFKFPKRLNYENLVSLEPVPGDSLFRLQGPIQAMRHRDGFNLTDSRMNTREVLDEVHYCVYCHKTDGDFCSKGFPVKKGDQKQGLKTNPLNEILTGCPLEEKISEMNYLKNLGYSIGALATVMIDNPMCPATGHRICNDCMKACIYQKQEPVNIPQIETRILTDVLSLPWGVEIYDLLTQWNPLRIKQWLPKPYTGKKVLVMGMGPAGFTLAHHLLMEGVSVVGTDGLKLEPLDESIVKNPIYRYSDLHENLSDRVMTGFGGVAEYGITVRWDKNFLKLIYISLLRRPYFQIYGSVRFGGTLKVDDVWHLGFDHLAIAVGAGLPREIAIRNSLAPGMRQANDFLMALQLTGAAKKTSLANLQVRLPAIVIGGGLTGIDTATEVQAYYIEQVEKMFYRYHEVVNFFGKKLVRNSFETVDLEILDEFIAHGQAVITERENALQQNRAPDFLSLIRHWGGVTIAYRREVQESPAYRRNHEEVIKALEEGIYYAEGLSPRVVKLDEYGQVSALVCQARVLDEEGVWRATDEETVLPARSIFVATGAKPNIAYEFEHRGTFSKTQESYERFELIDDQLIPLHTEGHCKAVHFGAFTSYQKDHHRVTFLGDTHPTFHGSVVKAIASAQRIYPKIVLALKNHSKQIPGDSKEYQKFKQKISFFFSAHVVSVTRRSPHSVELKIKAPLATQQFSPGQFYRLQNYERFAAVVGGVKLQTEAMAMIGVAVAEEPDVLSFHVLERGASSRLVATFKPGDPISLMGPTGSKIKIPTKTTTLMLIGGSMAAAHVLSLGAAYRKQAHRILYVACMKNENEIVGKEELESVTDAIIWVTEEKVLLKIRPQDRLVQGELVTVLRNYGLEKGDEAIPLSEIGQVMVVGSSQMIRRLQEARVGILKELFQPNAEWIASVYGPMQCMLKGVCAQCLQWQIDPLTGTRTKAVYACSWQHQPLDLIDVGNIDERLSQNRAQEILTNIWLDYWLQTHSAIIRPQEVA